MTIHSDCCRAAAEVSWLSMKRYTQSRKGSLVYPSYHARSYFDRYRFRSSREISFTHCSLLGSSLYGTIVPSFLGSAEVSFFHISAVKWTYYQDVSGFDSSVVLLMRASILMVSGSEWGRESRKRTRIRTQAFSN